MEGGGEVGEQRERERGRETKREREREKEVTRESLTPIDPRALAFTLTPTTSLSHRMYQLNGHIRLTSPLNRPA